MYNNITNDSIHNVSTRCSGVKGERVFSNIDIRDDQMKKSFLSYCYKKGEVRYGKNKRYFIAVY